MPDRSPAEEEVAAAARRRAAALAAGDEAALRLLMHPGLRWRAQRLDGVTVIVSGDTAVLTAAVTDEVCVEGREQAFRLRLTQTWVRTPTGWRCLAGHASAPPSP